MESRRDIYDDNFVCIKILVALMNSDPSYRIWRLDDYIEFLETQGIQSGLVMLLAGIPLTLERVSCNLYKLLFVIVQFQLNGSYYYDANDESHDNPKYYFETLKYNLKILVKNNPDLLNAKVQFTYIHPIFFTH